jgi:hypothetical protein
MANMMELATMLYNHERQNGAHKEEIMKEITENSMAPLYEQLCAKFNWPVDEELLRSMKYDARVLYGDLGVTILPRFYCIERRTARN